MLKVAAERDGSGKRLQPEEDTCRAAVAAAAPAEDHRLVALRDEEEALDHVREEC